MSPPTARTLALNIVVLLLAPLAIGQGTVFVEGDKVGIHIDTPAQEFHLNDGPDANDNGAFRISTASHAWDFATINNNGNFRISKLGTGGSEFDLSPTGSLTISGTLTTGGTTCGGGGCDLVFSPSYELVSLTEHSSQMWNLGYLPAVGPTPENRPFNLTEKVGGMLHELEMAHIYIDQLHEEIEVKDSELEQLREGYRQLAERLQRIEARLETDGWAP